MSKISENNFDPNDYKHLYQKACWNMRACDELPEPEIIYDPNDPGIEPVKKHERYRARLNVAQMPDYLDREKFEEYFQNYAEHSIGHCIIFDRNNSVIMADSIVKTIKDVPQDQIRNYIHVTSKLFEDTIIDTWKREGYGRKPTSQETENRIKETITWLKKKSEERGEKISSTSKIYYRSLEKLWNVDLSASQLGISSEEEYAANGIADVFSKHDWKNKKNWYHMMDEYANKISPILKQDFAQHSANTKNKPPKYVFIKGVIKHPQGCNCYHAPSETDNSELPPWVYLVVGCSGEIEKDDYIMIARNSHALNSEDKNAYLLTAISAGMEPSEAKRFWYRIEARKLIDIKETAEGRGSPKRSRFKKWKIGDPTETLDFMKSLSASPIVIPGRTTFREEKTTKPRGLKKLIAKPDLFIIIDSSGSMSGGPFESAKIGSFASLDAAERYGLNVSVIIHDSGVSYSDRKPLICDWTMKYKEAEDILLAKENAGGGTTFPTNEAITILKKNKNPVRTVWLTDAYISELNSLASDQNLNNFFRMATTKENNFTMLHITSLKFDNGVTNFIESLGGERKHIAKKEDIAGTIFGSVGPYYDALDRMSKGLDQ